MGSDDRAPIPKKQQGTQQGDAGQSRIPPILFALALEDWEIWERWRRAFHEGTVDTTTHSALPEDKARQAELETILGERLQIDPKSFVRATGSFEVDPKRKQPFQQPFALLVRWKTIGDNKSQQGNPR